LKDLLNQGSEVAAVKKVEETRARVVNVLDIFKTRGGWSVYLHCSQNEKKGGNSTFIYRSNAQLDAAQRASEQRSRCQTDVTIVSKARHGQKPRQRQSRCAAETGQGKSACTALHINAACPCRTERPSRTVSQPSEPWATARSSIKLSLTPVYSR